MHSYFTHKYQPPIYGSYPIFLAEVASTFNEELFNHYLIMNTNDKKTKDYLINSRLDEIRATLFRQTMFAEFELTIHQMVENGEPLTAEILSSEYRKLNEFYFGKNVVIDKEIDIEWARIPHFYYNYYVYQYATGISAAIALYQRVINGGEKELNDYIGFLKAGSSKYPLDILKRAGVDMSSSKPIIDSINYFRKLLEELKK
jgi:oligoendopeptidase F